ncbi:MAG: hypothetical protein MI723_15585 [Caulobacterales bacterium]|nr:hypothetical protein [Caulobacterales bacterium]
MGRRRAAGLAAALALLGAPAPAQSPGEEADITGLWAFEADPINAACRFWGEATITAGPEPGRYQCQLVANDVCPTLWSHRATQSCVALRDGDKLVIESRITQVEPDTNNYAPDDFELTIIDGALMTGTLHSAMTSDAVFRRTDIPIG